MQRILSSVLGGFAFALFMLTVLPIPLALAASEGAYTINLAPLMDAVLPGLLAVVGAVISAGLAWLLRLLAKFTGVTIDERHRKTLEGIVLSRVRQILTDVYEDKRAALNVNTKSALVAEVAGYATRKAPGAIKHFKLQPGDLEEFVAGRIGLNTLQTIQKKSVEAGSKNPLSELTPPIPKPKR